ncbi:hypothetical protein [Sphaerisporangium aureirubrum]|uniref:Secreted protein n=1 Tax=Sphaerisporangium aureirubrum TaxID=1544736 RepID=A0ABW1NRW0_9ACTN
MRRTLSPWLIRLCLIITCAVTLTSAGSAVPTQVTAPAAGTTAAGDVALSGLRCSGTTCHYYFSRARTAWIKTRLDAREWTTQAAAQLICLRVPHKIIAVVCVLGFSHLYDKARAHLDDAYDRHGCLVLRARLSLRKSITFSSVPPAHARCA